MAQPDEQGFSRKVYVTEFTGKYRVLVMGNGGSWCRKEGALGRVFNIERHKERSTIVYVRLHGYNKNPSGSFIPVRIREQMRGLPCAVLGICTNTEIDHKDGRKDNPRLQNPSRVSVDDFQVLTKAVNDAKRQHCRKCRETNRRFNAKSLGFRKSQIKGNGKYRGTCIGCYWHDPKTFTAFFIEP